MLKPWDFVNRLAVLGDGRGSRRRKGTTSWIWTTSSSTIERWKIWEWAFVRRVVVKCYYRLRKNIVDPQRPKVAFVA